MKLKHVSGLIVLLLTMLRGNSQVINTDSLNVYPESVVLKVYDVASKVSLTVSEQVALAGFFSDEEQNLYNMIQNGASTDAMDSAKLYYKYQFNNLLTADEIDMYYNARVSKDAERVAKLTTAMLQQKYNTNGMLQKEFFNIYYKRQTDLEKVLSEYTDPDVLDSNVYNTLVNYDSLADQYIKAAAGTAFLNTKFNFLDSVVGVDDHQWKPLTNLYYNLCISNTSAAYADIFNAAFSQVYTDISDSANYTALYNTEIMNNATTAMQAALQEYEQKNSLSKHVIRKLTPVILQREWALATINKIFPLYSDDKAVLIDTIVNTYQPAIDSLIAMDGNPANASQIDIAIKYSDLLGLNQDQVNKLQLVLLEYNRLKKEFRKKDAVGEYNSTVYESKVLNDILTNEEYTDVLTYKYQSTANSLAQQDWAEVMKHDDFSSKFDSTETVLELTNYHLSFLVAYYQNAFDKELQYESCARINELMPKVLVILKNEWDYQSAYGDGNDTFLQW